MSENQPADIDSEVLAQRVTSRIIGSVDKQRRVVNQASRIIDMLSGHDEDSGVSLYGERIGTSAPNEMPAMQWTDHRWPGLDGEGMTISGSIGGLYSDRFTDTRPSEAFNAGFYAGVLAAKMGLVDPETYHTDTESRQRNED